MREQRGPARAIGLRAGAVVLAMALARTASAAEGPEQLVREFVAAFNAHDVARMLTSCAADVRWMNVAGDKLTVDAAGTEKLAESMRGYFKSVPSSRSDLSSVAVSGNFVSAFEKANCVSKSGEQRSQCSASVYEVREGSGC